MENPIGMLKKLGCEIPWLQFTAEINTASNLFDVYKLTSSKRSNSSSVASIQWDIPRNEIVNWSFGLLKIVLTKVCRWRQVSSRSFMKVFMSKNIVFIKN